MKKWIKDKQNGEEGADAASSSAGSSAAHNNGNSGATSKGDEVAANFKGKKRGKAQTAAAGGVAAAVSQAQERERMLASLDAFRRSLAASGVQLCPEAALALEGIMIGEQAMAAAGSNVHASHAPLDGPGARDGVTRTWRGDSRNTSGGMYDAFSSSGGGSVGGGQVGSKRDWSSTTIAHDECAHQLVEMLHLLKKTPAMTGSQQSSPGASDMEGSGGSDMEDSAVGVGHRRTREGSREYHDDGDFLGGSGGGYGSGSRDRGDRGERDSEGGGSARGKSSGMISSHLQKLEEIRRKRKGGGSGSGGKSDDDFSGTNKSSPPVSFAANHHTGKYTLRQSSQLIAVQSSLPTYTCRSKSSGV